MVAQEIKVRGWNEFFETLGERNRVAASLRRIRGQFRGEDFNPSLVRHAARQFLRNAPEHPLAVPDAVASILQFLSDPIEQQGSERYSQCGKEDAAAESRNWARNWVRSRAALALFARRWAQKTGVPLRKSKRFA